MTILKIYWTIKSISPDTLNYCIMTQRNLASRIKFHTIIGLTLKGGGFVSKLPSQEISAIIVMM